MTSYSDDSVVVVFAFVIIADCEDEGGGISFFERLGETITAFLRATRRKS